VKIARPMLAAIRVNEPFPLARVIFASGIDGPTPTQDGGRSMSLFEDPLS
jgi:hypothetical protein